MQRFGHQQFLRFRDFIYDNYGIYFSDTKSEILQNKLCKLILKNRYTSYDEYYSDLLKEKEPSLLSEFANAITVNYTSFFREKEHFDFLKDYSNYLTDDREKEIRVWSAACSTGEEPYTLAIVLKEALHESFRIRILATDISSKAVSIAQKGTYSPSIKNDVGNYYLGKYFDAGENIYSISDKIKKLVTFRAFNLMEDFPFKKKFNLVFCRNVMIYFDPAVRQKLINKLYDAIDKGGLLIIGHSESLTGQKHNFRYLQPTVYIKD